MNTTSTRRVHRIAATAAVTCTLAGATALAAPNAAEAAAPMFPASTSTRVPTGWTVIESGALQGSSQASVYEVAPSGVQKLILSVPNREHVADVSGDGRRIATVSMTDTPIVRIYDLATHRVTRISTASYYARFTNPTGVNLLLLPSATRTSAVTRVNLNGVVQARYPGATSNEFVPSPNGALLWGANARGQVTVSNNATGKTLRTFAIPARYSQCMPMRTWDAGTAVALCYRPGSVQHVFLFHANGAATTALTTRLPGDGGYMNAWSTRAGLVAQIGSTCGPTTGVLVAGAKVRTIPMDALTNVRGTSAFGFANMTCGDSRPSYVRVDLPSMKRTRLFTPYAGRTVLGFRMNDITQGTIS